MIITSRKDFDGLLKTLRGKKKVFLLGCGECSTQCKTGGERDLKEMSEKLAVAGILTTGSVVVEEPCHIPLTKKELRTNKSAVDDADAVMVLACGAGVQSASEALPEKPVYSGVDTLFLGNINRSGDFTEKCSMCGQCELNSTAGLCPVTRCPKSLLNGPCGGMQDGMCEVDSEASCIWVEIYKRSEKEGRMDEYMTISPPKDYSFSLKPSSLKIR